MGKEITNNWYQILLEDLKKLEFAGVVMTKWNIGKRILKEEDNPKYGEGTIKKLAEELGTNSRELWLCVQFARKCDSITQFKDVSWYEITHKFLPEPRIKAETPELPEGKYQVIYADPPWKYDVDLSGDATRSPENNYPVMDLDELKEFGAKVKEVSNKNCVLFMWITAPKLNWMNDVLESWGFEYKTNLIWDKIKPMMGHYSSVRHEILVIAGKGSSAPLCDGKTIQSVDSVQYIEKTPKHSQKPEEFRKIIEKLYPGTKKMELFHRGTCPAGWTCWGNETI